MTNRQNTIVVKPFNRALIDTWQRHENTRRAFASVLRGVNVRRLDAGVLRTIARGH